MAIIILVFLMCLLIIPKAKTQTLNPPKTETKQSVFDKWTKDLNKRNFSDDIDKFKEEVKETTQKAKDSIQKYTPEVKRLFKSFGDYLKR